MGTSLFGDTSYTSKLIADGVAVNQYALNEKSVKEPGQVATFPQAVLAWTERGVSGAPPPRPAAMRYVSSIRALADEVGRPFDEVATVYQCELVRLAAHAVVLDYLPVLVAKRVRHMYKHRLDALHQHDPCAALLAAPRATP